MQSLGEMVKKGKTAGNKDGQGLMADAEGNQGLRANKMPPKAKPKSAAERKKDRIDGITKTVYPAFLGVLAGFACFYGADKISLLPWHFVMVVVILITYLIQKVTYPFIKIDVAGFHAKDWFYVEFMAIDLWLVTWTILLN
jgi:hypothetical protein